ncbi:hypothetical protein D3C75_1382730 [compost metagenome]
MGLAGGAQGLLAELRSGLLGGDHRFGIADDLCRRIELGLNLAGQLLDRIGDTGR